MSDRAVFLDRDGTLNVERDFVRCPDEIAVIAGVVPALRRLRDAGFRLVVVTNQSGIARGYLDEVALARVHSRLHESLDGLPAAYFHCPHHPEIGDGPYTRPCTCRKPKDGMVRRAIELLDLDPRGSWVVGDSARDVLLARDLPLRSALVRSGKPVDEQLRTLEREGFAADLVCDDLAAAVDAILTVPGGRR